MTTTPSPVYGGRYELRNQIARGGTAQVYLARDLLLDRPVALKVLFPELSSDHSFVERFRREAQAAANLMHPNIVQVFDWGESDRTYFIVMEYVDGEPLSSIIRTQAPLGDRQAASIASDIAKALSYAHRHGVVHRDIKPGNVLITADGQVKVTDFGIARAIGVDEQVTQTGLVMGTATYFSPEQAQGLPVDARSDVYALGVVLFEMLAGRPPFSGETPVAIAYQHVREQPPSLRSLNPAVPVALEAIVLQAMAKLPAERYVSADEMKSDLDRFVRGQTVLAAPPPGAGDTGPVTTVMAATGAGATGAGAPASGGRRSARSDARERRESRGRTTTPWWLAGGLVVLVAIGAVAYFGGRSLGYFGGRSSVAVANVVGKTAASATSVLDQQGLHVSPTTVKPRVGEGSKVGTVKSQSPAPGTELRTGDVVHVVVWGSLPRVTVPKVTGVTLSSAESELANAGLTYGVRYVKASRANERQGMVESQSPSAAAVRPEGTKVTLSVISGSVYATVPAVSGDSVSAATVALINAGFAVSDTQKSEISATVPTGDVIGTSPPAGQRKAPGTTVTLVVSKGSVTVPYVIGYTAAAAGEALIQDGLTFRPALQENVPASEVGLVVQTGPAPGTTVSAGRQIVLYIGAENGSTTPTTSTTSTTLPGSSSSTTLPGSSSSTTLPGSSIPAPSAPGSGNPTTG